MSKKRGGRFSTLSPYVVAALAISCAGLASAANNNGKNAYRWTDEHGVVHYGDSIPPQYSQAESSVLNQQGVEVGRHEAQKSQAQLEEEARKDQVRVQQKQRDTVLLTTYTSVKDIEQLRDERLEQLQGQRVAAEQYIATLHERLVALQARAMTFRPYNTAANARRMPDDLAEDVVRTLNEVRTQHNALRSRDADEAAMRAQFQADIDRYRELHVTPTGR
jgi:hypothetical protein